MTLTTKEKEIVSECARLMGLNGGLLYEGLITHPNLVSLRPGSADPENCISAALCHLGNKYGLRNHAVGQIVHEAVWRRDVEMPIHIRQPIKPELDYSEIFFLKSIARVLIPKGGNFYGYRKVVAEETGVKRWRVDKAVGALIQRFSAANIEEAIVMAFATEILDHNELFAGEAPKPLTTIMAAEQFRRLRGYSATGVHLRTLSEVEESVASRFIDRIGENGGLFWRGWQEDVAQQVGMSIYMVDHVIVGLRNKFGVHSRGLAFYKAGLLL